MTVKPGLTFTAGGAEIAVYSEHATAAFICLYDETGAQEIGRVELSSDGSGWRRAELPGLKPGARYGLRFDGPFEPWRGHRFDVSKLLVDPYASRLDRAFALRPELFEFGADTGPFAPKCVAVEEVVGEPGLLRRLRLNGMRADVSWRGPAKRYAALYRGLAAGPRG